MWKADKPVTPYNHTSHVKVDNKDFVANLRRTVSLDTELKKLKEEKMSAELVALEKKLAKPTNCIFQSCMAVGYEIAEALNEVCFNDFFV